MSERSQLIARLLESQDSRASYVRGKVNVLVPAQLHALRTRLDKTQQALAQMAGMKQSRISAMERPGAVNFNVETLVRMAATLRVGLKVEFVPFSEMLNWENRFDQDHFEVIPIEEDTDFLTGRAALKSAGMQPIAKQGKSALEEVAVQGQTSGLFPGQLLSASVVSSLKSAGQRESSLMRSQWL